MNPYFLVGTSLFADAVSAFVFVWMAREFRRLRETIKSDAESTGTSLSRAFTDILNGVEKLQKQAGDLAYGTRILNAAAKREAAESAARDPNPRMTSLEAVRIAAVAEDANRTPLDQSARNRACGLIAPGALGLPQDRLLKNE